MNQDESVLYILLLLSPILVLAIGLCVMFGMGEDAEKGRQGKRNAETEWKRLRREGKV